jgi:hypothetical protein
MALPTVLGELKIIIRETVDAIPQYMLWCVIDISLGTSTVASVDGLNCNVHIYVPLSIKQMTLK